MNGGPGQRADRPIVYDTDQGMVCPDCHKPVKGCTCRQKHSTQPQQRVAPKADGVVRVSRDRRNRRGKTVTVVTGVTGGSVVDEVAGTLKRLCGSGGTVKDGIIEIQGDHRDLVLSKLTEMGYKVKLAGG